MSFQAYLDTIKKKTGKGPDDFVELAAEKGLLGPTVKAGAVIDWLAADYGLGRGHAMAIYAILKSKTQPRPAADERIDKQFAGAKAVWSAPYDALLHRIQEFGPDVSTQPTDSYISLVRNGKKFAIVAVASKRLDLGIKLKGTDAVGRLAEAGSWNSMVTHRVQIADPAELDDELLGWLRDAYDRAA
jgi:predicted transport protein